MTSFERTTLPAVVAAAIVAAAGALPDSSLADESLAALIEAGDSAAALRLVEAGADVDAAQGDGTTPLHWAVYRIEPALVDALLARGADPNATNLYGSSPLSEAVKIADPVLVEKLLAAGADPEAPNADGQTALMLAARAGALDVARLLLEHGADVNRRELWRGQTALMWAADEAQTELTRLLIEHGADVDARSQVNDWPRNVTAEPRTKNLPAGGFTPLLYAARQGCLECARHLVDAGAGEAVLGELLLGDPQDVGLHGFRVLLPARPRLAGATRLRRFSGGSRPQFLAHAAFCPRWRQTINLTG